MYCDRCGAALPEGAAFCPACGKNLGTTASPVARSRLARHLPVVSVLWMVVSALWLIGGIYVIAVGSLFLPMIVTAWPFERLIPGPGLCSGRRPVAGRSRRRGRGLGIDAAGALGAGRGHRSRFYRPLPFCAGNRSRHLHAVGSPLERCGGGVPARCAGLKRAKRLRIWTRLDSLPLLRLPVWFSLVFELPD